MSQGPAPFRVISNLEVALCILAGITPFFLFWYLGQKGLGIATAAIVGVLLLTLTTSWPLRRERWFWATFSLIGAFHVIAIFEIDWSIAAHWTGLTIMPFMAVDTLVSLGLVYLVYRALYGRPDQLFVAADAEDQRYSERADL